MSLLVNQFLQSLLWWCTCLCYPTLWGAVTRWGVQAFLAMYWVQGQLATWDPLKNKTGWGFKAGRSLRVWGQQGLPNQILSQKTNNKKMKPKTPNLSFMLFVRQGHTIIQADLPASASWVLNVRYELSYLGTCELVYVAWLAAWGRSKEVWYLCGYEEYRH